MAEDEEEDYDEAFNQSQTGDEFDRQIPANILDKEYRRKLRPDPRLQFREARVASPNKMGSQNQLSDEDNDEAKDSQVEPAMEADGIMMGVDVSLRLAPQSELINIQQKSKTNRYQRTIKSGIYTRNPRIVDEETGGTIVDPLIDVNGNVQSAGYTPGFWDGSGTGPDTTGYDPENAIISEWEWYQYTGTQQAVQFPLKAPRRGEINYMYMWFKYSTFGSPNCVIYLLDMPVDITVQLSQTGLALHNERRHIIYQYGTASAPFTANELADAIDPPARYINRDPDPKQEYRLWVRIESVGSMQNYGFNIGLNIRRLG